jgi:hypothetical protein
MPVLLSKWYRHYPQGRKVAIESITNTEGKVKIKSSKVHQLSAQKNGFKETPQRKQFFNDSISHAYIRRRSVEEKYKTTIL